MSNLFANWRTRLASLWRADADAATSEPAAPVHWSPATRVGFRFAFCYFMLYALGCGNATVWEVIPFGIGDHIAEWLAWPFEHAGQWVGQHWLHLTGVAAKLHPGGSGDKATDWLAMGVMLTIAVFATLVWSALDRRRTAYPVLFAWFRFTMRLTLGVAMFDYGLAKVFPFQMPLPSLAVLNEPLGNTSPMTLLWTLIGLNPVYEMVCGSAEVIAGLLILFRRTALLGALVTAFVVANVVLYNFFFDVPVKIYATHLLLMALVIIVPDARALFRFFWLHVPAAPCGAWVPASKRRAFRIATAVVEGFVVLMMAVVGPIQIWPQAMELRAHLAHPGPLTGEWHVLTATKPVPTGEQLPVTEFVFEPSGFTMLRASDDSLWRSDAEYDEKQHTLKLHAIGINAEYAVQQPDATHLALTPTGKDAAQYGTLTLAKIPLPAHYPLEERGFHLVNEWGLER